MADKGESNGRVPMLLWVNTMLTALILPLLGFMGSRLWTSVESNATALNDLKLEVGIIKERQARVLTDVPKLMSQDVELQKLFDEHVKKWHSNP